MLVELSEKGWQRIASGRLVAGRYRMRGPVAGRFRFYLEEPGCSRGDGMVEADDIVMYIEEDAILAPAFVQLEHVARAKRALEGEAIA